MAVNAASWCAVLCRNVWAITDHGRTRDVELGVDSTVRRRAIACAERRTCIIETRSKLSVLHVQIFLRMHCKRPTRTEDPR